MLKIEQPFNPGLIIGGVCLAGSAALYAFRDQVKVPPMVSTGLLCLGAGLVITGCASSTEVPDEEISHISFSDLGIITLELDERFTTAEIQLILNGVDDWIAKAPKTAANLHVITGAHIPPGITDLTSPVWADHLYIVACPDGNDPLFQSTLFAQIGTTQLPEGSFAAGVTNAVQTASGKGAILTIDVSGAEQYGVFQTAVAHEVGHYLGCGHVPDSAALMSATVSPGQVKVVNQSDLTELCTRRPLLC